MARTARKISATGLYHVVARGNNKENIFTHSSEKRHFMKLVAQAHKEHEIQLYAYCIMRNHFHIMLKAEDLQELSNYMQWLILTYAQYYNFKHNRTGHVFQGRYHSECIETESYYWSCIRYIHNNPVKIYQVSRPEDYEYSSAKDYLRRKSSLICPAAMTMLQKNFDCVESFMQFQKLFDSKSILDIKEDTELYEAERMQAMVQHYCKEYQLENKGHLYATIDLRREFIAWCNQETQIAKYKIENFLRN